MTEDRDCTLTVRVENTFPGDGPKLHVKEYGEVDEGIAPGHKKPFQLKKDMEICFDLKTYKKGGNCVITCGPMILSCLSKNGAEVRPTTDLKEVISGKTPYYTKAKWELGEPDFPNSYKLLIVKNCPDREGENTESANPEETSVTVGQDPPGQSR
jgi:hypothetical protein